MKLFQILPIAVITATITLTGCHDNHDEHHGEHHQHKIMVTSALAKDVVLTQKYVCQIHSRQHIAIRAMQEGYLDTIRVREGQEVKKGDLLFEVVPTLYKAKLEAEKAEAKLAQLELNLSQSLANDRVVSPQEVNLYQAKLLRAQANLKLAEAEFDFTLVKAPFDGIIDRLHEQKGSLVKENDILTTLSDNKVMWVYFNVPEARYLEYMVIPEEEKARHAIELELADGRIYPETGRIAAIEAQFNSESGNIPFRADFANPDRLLRHGMTGNVLVHNTLKNAVVIPQRATFEILDKQYVFVVDEKHVVHQRLIVVKNELPDIFIIQKGLEVGDRIVCEGVRQVHDGEHVEYEYREPAEVLANQKYHAE